MCSIENFSLLIESRNRPPLSTIGLNMSGSKPVALFAHRDDEDSKGWPESLFSLYHPHFNLKTLKEAQQENVLEKTEAIFMDPSQTSRFVALFKQLPLLKVIATVSAGYNHMDAFDKDYIKEKGIQMCFARGVLDTAVADLSMGLILVAARNIVPGVRSAMSPSPPTFRYADFGMEVSGATVGIVGFGGVGQAVAKRAYNGFSMKVLYHTRTQRPSDVETPVGAQYFPSLDAMLPLCDFVVLACALTPETENLFSTKQFQLMKSTASIINVARGQIIDQEALVEALNSQTIRSAALDVTAPEPLPRDHPLLQCENCVIIPHYGSATLTTRQAMHQAVIDDALAALQGKPMARQLVL